MVTLTPITELRRMTLAELLRELRGKRSEYAKLRMAVGMQSEKNHAQLCPMRRDIARMDMVARELDKHTKKSLGKASQKTAKPVQQRGTK